VVKTEAPEEAPLEPWEIWPKRSRHPQAIAAHRQKAQRRQEASGPPAEVDRAIRLRALPLFREVYQGLEPGDEWVEWAATLLREPERLSAALKRAERAYRDFRRVPVWRRAKAESRWARAAITAAQARFALELAEQARAEAKGRRYRKLEGADRRNALAKQAEELTKRTWARLRNEGQRGA
jgi:hypothetical protein